MRKKRNLIVCFLFLFNFALKAQEGFIAVPVADLLGQSMKSILEARKQAASDRAILKAYDTIALSPEKNDISCPRIYQLLFNEQVKILEEHGPEIKIEVPYALYAKSTNKRLSGIYWTLKKNVITKDAIGKTIFQKAIPDLPPYESQAKKTLVLKKPFFNRVTKTHYSAGTRFIIHQTSSKKNPLIRLYNPLTKKIITTSIPRSYCLFTPQTHEQAHRQFLALIKEWSLTKNPVPYVWGGASFTQTTNSVQSGFDCAGLIIRAAQSCNIPFFLKNSSALKYHLENRGTKKIQPGDILWFPGHVIILNDPKRNAAIEARGYASGFGKLHELPLDHIFKNIATYKELENASRNNVPLELLNKEGEVKLTIPTYKILNLSSVWCNYRKHATKLN